jgi:hypothetical protein
MASVSQNDWHGSCQCARCKAVDEEEGSPAGTMLRFVNAVAADIGPEFPDVAISTLAYQYTRKPPKKTRPRDNVVVWLCSIECSFSHPLATDKRNQDFREDIEGWAKVADRLYVWDYTTNFRHYVFPHPNLRVLGPNVKFFAENNVVGLFEQGAYQSPGSEMMELRAWVLAKLLWDPARDAQALIDEFLDGYYGSAAPHIRAYLNLMHDVMQAGRQSLGCFEEPTRKFAQPEVLIKAWQHLEAAENAARTNKELARVRVAQMPMMYALLICWYPADLAWKKAPETVPWPIDEPPDKLFARFMTIARSAGVTMIAEQVTLDEITRRIKLPE